MPETYNGWRNYETWNCALWINNDEPLYRAALDSMRGRKSRSPYTDFLAYAGLIGERTPDGVLWSGRRVSRRELNDMMRELA